MRVVISLLVAFLAGMASAYRGSILFDTFMSDDPASDPCYDDKLKKSIACIPDFVNAAFGIPVEASSTCGETPREFCTAPGSSLPKRKRNIGDFGSFNRLPVLTAASAGSGMCAYSVSTTVVNIKFRPLAQSCFVGNKNLLNLPQCSPFDEIQKYTCFPPNYVD